MRRRLLVIAVVAAVMPGLRMPRGSSRRQPVGHEVRIASAVPCDGRLPPGEAVRVVSRGRVTFRSQDLPLDELDSRLATTFLDRTQPIVFLRAGDGIGFRDIAEVIAIAKKQADYVVLVPPSTEQALRSEIGLCLDSRITFPEILM